MDNPMDVSRARELAEARVRRQVAINIAWQMDATMTLRRKIRDQLKTSVSPLAITARKRVYAR